MVREAELAVVNINESDISDALVLGDDDAVYGDRVLRNSQNAGYNNLHSRTNPVIADLIRNPEGQGHRAPIIPRVPHRHSRVDGNLY